MMSSFDPQGEAETRQFVADPLAGAGLVFRPASLASETDEARPDLAEVAATAFEMGRAKGRAELPWQEAEALREVTEVLGLAAGELAELRAGYLLQHRRAILDLALAVAGRILRREVENDVDSLSSALESALAALDSPGPAVLELAAQDLEVVEQGLAPRLQALAADAGLCVEASAELSRGDLRLRADSTEVDARVVEVLRRLREELEDTVRVDEVSTVVEPGPDQEGAS